MDIGNRLKNARLEAGLSQKALCGDVITRNMLSLIESGRARPSMDTLGYLARQLGKPMGYFLEDQAVTSPNQAVMDQAREAFAQGHYRQALTVLEDYRADDPVFDGEKGLLQSLCMLELGRQSLAQGKDVYARSLVSRAGGDSIYWVPALERERLLLLSEAGEPITLPADDRPLLHRAQVALDAGDFPTAARILDAAQDRQGRWCLLRGQTAMGLGDYAGAVTWLQGAEQAGFGQAVPMLETCYRELADYKMAYEYACKQR